MLGSASISNCVTSISNCVSGVNINSSTSGEGAHGGLVGTLDDCTVIIDGCVFNGSLLGPDTNGCGGFIGWRNGGASISNSLFIPSEVTVSNVDSATFARNTADTYNCFFTDSFYDNSYPPTLANDSVTPQKWYNGTAPRTVKAGDEYVTVSGIALTGDATSYPVSGVTAYSGGGLSYDGSLYYGSGDTVSFTLSHRDRRGYTFEGYTASVDVHDDSTLTMPDEDVTVSTQWTRKTYAVNVTAGAHMTKKSGEASQTVNAGDAMTAVVYTASKGYYFPEDYTIAEVNGVNVTRDRSTQITVSGVPTAAAEITLEAATAETNDTHLSRRVIIWTPTNGAITVMRSDNNTPVTSGEILPEGTTITVSATPDNGYDLKELRLQIWTYEYFEGVEDFVPAGWKWGSNGGLCIDNGSSFTIEENKEYIFNATFDQNVVKYSITKNITGQGSLDVTSESVAGNDISIAYTPGDSYKLESLTVTKADNSSVGAAYDSNKDKYYFTIPRQTSPSMRCFLL